MRKRVGADRRWERAQPHKDGEEVGEGGERGWDGKYDEIKEEEDEEEDEVMREEDEYKKEEGKQRRESWRKQEEEEEEEEDVIEDGINKI